MKNNKLPAGQFLNVFDLDEIAIINQAFGRLPDAQNSGAVHHAYTNGFRPSDTIFLFFKKIVLPKLENNIGRKLNLTCGMLLKESKPWNIHTDYVKSDINPDLGILIPLNTQPLNTHTVVFNQECTGTIEDFVKSNNKLTVNAANLSSTLMSHEPIENLEYVSLLEAFPWTPGSVIYWDRKLLHASDNFLANHVTEKTALVLFTNHDS